jgi:hypothetical protein
MRLLSPADWTRRSLGIPREPRLTRSGRGILIAQRALRTPAGALRSKSGRSRSTGRPIWRSTRCSAWRARRRGLSPRVFYGARDRLFRPLGMPRWLKPALGAFAVGLIGVRFPSCLGMGYGTIQEAIDRAHGIGFLVAFAALKMATTSFTVSSGGSGGVFGPSLVPRPVHPPRPDPGVQPRPRSAPRGRGAPRVGAALTA